MNSALSDRLDRSISDSYVERVLHCCKRLYVAISTLHAATSVAMLTMICPARPAPSLAGPGATHIRRSPNSHNSSRHSQHDRRQARSAQRHQGRGHDARAGRRQRGSRQGNRPHWGRFGRQRATHWCVEIIPRPEACSARPFQTLQGMV